MSEQQGDTLDSHEEIDKNSAKKQAIIDLLPKKAYHVGKVCKQLGIPRSTYYLWKKQDADFDEQTEEIFEYDIDDSEEKLRLLRQGLPKFKEDENGNKVFNGWIEKPHFGALMAHLEAKGKDRGYGRTLSIESGVLDMVKNMTDEELYNEIKQLEEIAREDDG